MTVHEFVTKIEALAAANDDEFSVTFAYYTRQRRWSVIVMETEDGHEFIGGSGATPDKACDGAAKCIASAAESWGYNLPEEPKP